MSLLHLGRAATRYTSRHTQRRRLLLLHCCRCPFAATANHCCCDTKQPQHTQGRGHAGWCGHAVQEKGRVGQSVPSKTPWRLLVGCVCCLLAASCLSSSPPLPEHKLLTLCFNTPWPIVVQAVTLCAAGCSLNALHTLRKYVVNAPAIDLRGKKRTSRK